MHLQPITAKLANKRYSRDADRLFGSFVSDSPSGLGDILVVEISLEYQQSFIMVSGTASYANCIVVHALIQNFNLMTTSFGKPPPFSSHMLDTFSQDRQSYDMTATGRRAGGRVRVKHCVPLLWDLGGAGCEGHGSSRRKWPKAGATGVHGTRDASVWSNSDATQREAKCKEER